MSALDLTESIAPKSDQLNADDLISGPRTFTITEVRKGSAEQPFDFHLAEFPGRPYRPSKSMRRVMVLAWGPKAAEYIGRRVTLYREPTVRWAGEEIGGIRISHMSHLAKPIKTALTESNKKRSPFTVQPLVEPKVTTDKPDVPNPDSITADQSKELAARLRDNDLTERADVLAYVAGVIGRDITSSKELTQAEASTVIDSLEVPPAPEAEPTLDGLS